VPLSALRTAPITMEKNIVRDRKKLFFSGCSYIIITEVFQPEKSMMPKFSGSAGV
jgi:hypothetical protein